jgi:N-acyl-D-aspartate/D-glutamate deacylase
MVEERRVVDAVLRGGLVVDGTGAAPRRADVAVDDGRVVAVGPKLSDGGRVVDVDGLVVAPGFIDIHTHYDAQVEWDANLSPSALHGVTTVVGGNCGFTVAPVTPEHAPYLTRLLARVEGMPLEALESGLSFAWSSFGDWLDRIEGRTALNVGFLVGHSALRRLVLGKRATEAPATDDEVRRMQALLAESIAAGGLGFSSSWSPAHNDWDGNPVPSRAASAAELVAMAKVVRGFEGAVLQFVPGAGSFGPEAVDAMIAMSRAANRPINWNVLRVDNPDDMGSAETRLQASEVADRNGAAIVGLTNPDPLQLRVSIATVGPFRGLPGWDDFMASSAEEQLRALRDPARRQPLRDSAAQGDLKWPRAQLRDWAGLTVSETFCDANRRYEGWTVGAVARELGGDPFDAFALLVARDELRTFFLLPPLGDDEATWRLRVDILRDRRTLLGGSDAGAHLSQMCGARYTSSLLATGVRKHHLLGVEEAVHHLTDAPARFYGLRDRGRVQPGYWADLVVFDPEAVDPGRLRTSADLPGGMTRLHSDPRGIVRVFTNGTEIVAHGRPTGSLPGRLLRSNRGDTTTVSIDTHRAGQLRPPQ